MQGVEPTLPTALTDPHRLEALRATGLVGSPPEPSFDRVVDLARRLLGAPSALVNLVDDERQWTKAAAGWDADPETALEGSLCKIVGATGAPLALQDTAPD